MIEVTFTKEFFEDSSEAVHMVMEKLISFPSYRMSKESNDIIKFEIDELNDSDEWIQKTGEFIFEKDYNPTLGITKMSGYFIIKFNGVETCETIGKTYTVTH